MSTSHPHLPLEKRHVVAIGGAMMTGNAKALFRYMLALANRRKRKPHVLFMTTATGDSPDSRLTLAELAGGEQCVPSHLGFFSNTPPDVESIILGNDVIFVGGGNTKSMLAVWREYGVDKLLHEAWRRGIVLGGSSAGGICWFESCVTDSFAGPFTPLPALGILAGSCCPHFNRNGRRDAFHSLVKENRLTSGYAIDEVTALHFRGDKLHAVISGKPGHAGYRVELSEGDIREGRLEATLLE